MKPLFYHKRNGSILVFALWAMTLLSIFAVYLGVGVRQKIILLARLEQRARLNDIAQAGVKKAIVLIQSEFLENNQVLSVQGKINLYNNDRYYRGIEIENSVGEVSYDAFDDAAVNFQKRFGVIDEERKANVNKIDLLGLKRLIADVMRWDSEQAHALALSIIDWREYGESEIEGFSSDAYYENLQFPYEPKNSDFELIDELLLVKGMTPEILKKLSSFVTVYGDGAVNLNTASRVVLMAVGTSGELTDKILSVRRGPDGIEATEDDFIFSASYDLFSNLQKFVKINKEEEDEINYLNGLRKFCTNSSFYLIKSSGKIAKKDSKLTVRCVFNLADKKIEYWQDHFGGY
ncbi:MAG: hypothetical protein WC676_08640 [Candidatus Omnitrophota bacterium]